MQCAKTQITLQTHIFFGISERKGKITHKKQTTTLPQGEEKSFVLSHRIHTSKFLTTETLE